MIKILKQLGKLVGLHIPYRAAKKWREARTLTGRSNRDIFTKIYESNSWNGKESISGQGSDLAETQILLAYLPPLLRQYKIKTMIDLPCGDFNWMQYLDYDFDHYTGIDIVENIIRNNQQKFGTEKRKFECRDCLQDDIGTADLLMCRDLLIHFSDRDIKRFFTNILKSNIRYLLTTDFIDEKNTDIATGQWRPVNLTVSPYNLPPPLERIVEETKMFDGKFSHSKTMSLWLIEDIRQTIDDQNQHAS